MPYDHNQPRKAHGFAGRRNGRDMEIVRLLVLIVVALASLTGCRREPSPEATARGFLAARDDRPAYNVLLITLDTTRADRLGCYGHADARTPTLDGLAERGVLFENAVTSAPMTLPAHATILTGLDPPEHGLRTNGRGALPAGVPVLTEAFQQAGYETGAFLSSFVLERRFGLARGFDNYDDNFPVPTPTDAFHKPLSRERHAGQVTRRAMLWLDKHLTKTPDRPFFCWVHYFDPHHPYAPPSRQFLDGIENPYDAEIAFVDLQISRLLDHLENRNRLEKTLVVVVGDHGESLGEHGEDTHAFFIYEAVMHVPFIITLPPEVASPPRRVSTLVGLIDLYRTLADLYDFPVPDTVRGRSLAPALFGGSLTETAYYGESQTPWLNYSASPLRSLTREKWRFIDAPRPELYDRLADPRERQNLFNQFSSVATEYQDRLGDMVAGMVLQHGESVQLDAAARAELASLGYLTGAEEPGDIAPSPDLPDPKDMVNVLRRIAEAEIHASKDEFDEAIRVLKPALADAPQAFVLHFMLSEFFIRTAHWQEAREHAEVAVRLHPHYVDILTNLGNIYLELGDEDKAVQHYEATLTLEPGHIFALQNLAAVLAGRGERQRAAELFRRVLNARPTFAAHLGLGRLLLAEGRTAQAVQHLEQALVLRSNDEEALWTLLEALVTSEQFDRALHPAIRLVQNYPEQARYHRAIADLYLQLGRLDQAAAGYQAALKLEPTDPAALRGSADIHLRRGQPAEAIPLLEKARTAAPADRPTRILLHQAYRRLGRYADARDNLESAIAAGVDDPLLRSGLAWLLATCQDARVRNGPRAREMAERALESFGASSSMLLDTRAAAHAECGDFTRAVQDARAALELARQEGDETRQQGIAARLALYEQSKPYRDTP
jgi:arylsulfatase A-like enzyme/Flp pilus assembly protein TadD